MQSDISRRKFLQNASLSAGTIALPGHLLQTKNQITGSSRLVNLGTVSIMDMSAPTSTDMIQQVLGVMDEIIPYQPDIICLPEIFAYSGISGKYELKDAAEKVPGPVVTPFLNFAATHRCYVICPTYVLHEGNV